MGDLKGELSKIRGKIKSSGRESSRSDSREELHGTLRSHQISTKSRSGPGVRSRALSAKAREVLESMPFIGRVRELQIERGFGFVEYDLGRVMFHVTNRSDRGTPRLDESLHGQLIHFALGTSPRSREKRPQAILWCPIRDSGINIGAVELFQKAFDNYRRIWLESLDLADIRGILPALWYSKLWRPQPVPADLEDTLLASRLTSLLRELAPDSILSSGLPEVLARSPYGFAAQWSGRSERPGNLRLLKDLPVKKLVVLGSPNPAWMDKLTGEDFVKAGMWALRQPVEKVRLECLERWKGDRVEEGEMASRLLSDGWIPEGAEINWLVRLKKSGQLESSSILQVLQNNPSQWKEWYPLLDPENARQVHRGRIYSRPELIEFLANQSGQAALEALACHAVSIDLETDGETIREIGLAHWGEDPQVYRAADGELDAGEAALRQALAGATVVVGHNIHDWDLPIIELHFGIKLSELVWDTLLVQAILTPWSATLALGGTHSAGKDAHEAMLLFVKQLEELPKQSILSILAGEVRSSKELISLIWGQVARTVWFKPNVPKEIENAAAASRRGAGILASSSNLRRFDWLPCVAVVSAVEDEDLDPALWSVSSKMLEATDEQGTDPLKTEVVLGILRIAESQDISVRFDMLPLWLRGEHDSALQGRIREACTLPQQGQDGWAYISPLPRRAGMLPKATSEGWIILGSPVPRLVTAMSGLSANGLPDFAKQAIGNRVNEVAGGLKGFYRCTDPARLVTCWVYPERVAQRLKSTAGFLECLEAVSAESLKLRWMSLPDPPKPMEVLVPKSDAASLHPNSLDPQTYWVELIDRFRQGLLVKPEGVVPILLIESTRSEELRLLVTAGLADLGMAEVPNAHHGRSERLRRARTQDLCLVDFVDSWEAWRDIANQVAVPLLPYLEVLPLERFLVETQESQDDPIEASSVDAEMSETDDTESDEELASEQDSILPDPVIGEQRASDEWLPTRTLLAAIPALLRNRLHSWLGEAGLVDESNARVVVLDARVTEIAGRLKHLVTIVQNSADPLSQEASARLRASLAALGVQREEPPSSLADLQDFMVQHWNAGRSKEDPNYIPGFREQTQVPAIEAIRTRSRHVVVSLPTGEGKSVLFQVPALCRGLHNRRLTLVLSPLKALMKDQFEGLERLGFGPSVGYLSSDQTPAEISETLQGVLEHRIVMLYVAPERFRNARFFDVLQRRALIDEGLEYVVFDEAHCISQWGYEFRPDYFHALQTLKESFESIDSRNPAPFLFFSATLTQNDRDGLARLMGTDERSEGSGFLPLQFVPEAFNDPIRDFIQLEPRQAQGGFSRWDAFEKEVAPRLEIIAEECRSMQRNRNQTGQHSSMIIFVGRRYHAEMLAAIVERNTGMTCAFYHAGMDDEERGEVYTGFRNGSIDVLVATKAFGMGMDIPHIHWAIHLTPPSYLEDYLQEVGRIGRGIGERNKAELEKLRAILIWSRDDFSTNRELRARGQITFNRVRDWLNRIREVCREVSPGQALAVVPDTGFLPQISEAKERAVSTELRMCLFWLEKAGKLEIAGSVPGILPATIRLNKLRSLAEDQDSPIGRVAALILQAQDVQEEEQTAKRQAEPRTNPYKERPKPAERPRGFLAGLIDALSSVVGIFLPATRSEGSVNQKGEPTDNSPETPIGVSSESTGQPDELEALINLGQVLTDGDLKTVDKTLETIAQIEGRGGLRIQRKLSIKVMELAGSDQCHLTSLLKAIQNVGAYLISEIGTTGRKELDWENLALRFQEYEVGPGPAANWTTSFKSGLRSALRCAGVRIHQRRQADGTIREVAQLPRALVKKSKSMLARTLAVSRKVLDQFHASLHEQNPQIDMGKLVRVATSVSPRRKFDKSLLWKALRVLAAAKVLSAPRELLPRSYLLMLDPNDSELTEEKFEDCREELRQFNELAEQRIHCMEVFANLPEDIRLPFIRDYFGASGAEGLRQVMEAMLLEIEAEGDVSDWIDPIRDSIREKSATEEMQKFRDDPEEPNQWAAITRPFRHPVLVNAGPGSGKTAVLLARLFHLIREQGLPPEQILVLAFNRAVVFELRSRLQQLFRSLGYPRYVRRLKIHTFHGFALRSLPEPEGGDMKKHREHLLENFARALTDEQYAREVASGFRALLVDEFQDVDDDIFCILTALKRAADSDAGLFAIGDDDQDILRWKRREESGSAEFSDAYFTRFVEQFEVDEKDRFSLRVNFRSGNSIVERSQNFINKFFEESECRSRRMKSERLRARRGADDGLAKISKLDDGGLSEMSRCAAEFCQSELKQHDTRTVAILCRRNSEVAEHYLSLKEVIPNVTLQAGARARLSELRHLGALTDILRARENTAGDLYLTDELIHDLCLELEAKGVAEVRFPRPGDLTAKEVFELSRKEFPRPSLRNVIELLEGTTLDEAERILGLRSESGQFVVVSTIHKVKGLEFDSVFIASSGSPFLVSHRRNGHDGLPDLAAEEARLYYVGMTRAKKRLQCFFGPRERAWWKGHPYQGTQVNQRMLTGNHEEVVISWAMQENEFSSGGNACQEYIEKEPCVGDLIILGGVGGGRGRVLNHRSRSGDVRQVGFLSKKAGAGGPGSHLMVAAVVRTRLDEEAAHGNQWGVPSQVVRERGWGYTVLVAGILSNG
jgi:superfamily II DNA helicase RecQ